MEIIDEAGNPLLQFLDQRIAYGVEFARPRDILPGLMEVIQKHVECTAYRENRARRKELGESK